MRLLLIELHGMDVSCLKDMNFLRSIAKPHVFRTYTGLAGSAALWTGKSDIQKDGEYHDHFWDGTSGLWDANIFRLLRGDLHLSRNRKNKFRLTRTKGYFQDCELFKQLDFSFSERPIIATNKNYIFDFSKNESERINKFKKYWHHTLNYIRLNKIDRLSHKYGPDSEESKEYSKFLDGKLKEIYQQYEGEIIVFAICGMMKPSKQVNVMDFLGGINGLVFFIDDKNIRIWDTGNKSAINKALSYINDLGCGEWLQEKPERKFGDYFYKADDGIAFVPNTYVKNDIKGIHTLNGWMISNCATVDHIREFKNFIIGICTDTR